jgi:hypothetical protein
VSDAQTPAGLLKSSLSAGMKRVVHGENQIVIGHHGFDPAGQLGYQSLQESHRIATGAIGTSLGDRFPRIIIHRCKSILPPSVSPTIEIFQVDSSSDLGLLDT